MSVYTSVSESQLRAFLKPLSVGELTGYQGIEGGVVNSNFFVDTHQGSFVLTLFEELEANDLPFYLKLNKQLADSGLPCARAQADSDGNWIFSINEKPACLFTRLPGEHLDSPTRAQCYAVGQALGKLHVSSQSFPLQRASDRDLDWFATTIDQVLPLLDPGDAKLLKDEWNHHQSNSLEHLPSGIVHADLFRDNVLFVGERLSGLLDFYFACNGVYLYDLAITANDWCITPSGHLNEPLASALLDGYESERTLTTDEKSHWFTALRLAALRFWLSRLQESLFPAEGELVLIKDPDAFKRIVLARKQRK